MFAAYYSLHSIYVIRICDFSSGLSMTLSNEAGSSIVSQLLATVFPLGWFILSLPSNTDISTKESIVERSSTCTFDRHKIDILKYGVSTIFRASLSMNTVGDSVFCQFSKSMAFTASSVCSSRRLPFLSRRSKSYIR